MDFDALFEEKMGFSPTTKKTEPDYTESEPTAKTDGFSSIFKKVMGFDPVEAPTTEEAPAPPETEIPERPEPTTPEVPTMTVPETTASAVSSTSEVPAPTTTETQRSEQPVQKPHVPKIGISPVAHPGRFSYEKVGDPPHLMLVYDSNPNLKVDLSKPDIPEDEPPTTMEFTEPMTITGATQGGGATERPSIPVPQSNYGMYAPPTQSAIPKKPEEEEEEKTDKMGTPEAMARSFGQGAAELALNTARLPQSAAEVYLALNNYTNRALNYGIKKVTGKEKGPLPEIPLESIPKFIKLNENAWDTKLVRKFADSQKEALKEATNSKKVLDNLAEGNFSEAGKSLGIQVAAQIPLILSFFGGGALGAGAKVMGGFAGATEVSRGMDQYWKDVEAGIARQRPEKAAINAAVNGLIEGLGEQFVTGNYIEGAFKTLKKVVPEKAAKKAVGNAVGKAIGRMLKVGGREATEESIVNYSQAVMDKLFGKRDVKWYEAIKEGIEAGIVGFFTSAATTGPLKAYAETRKAEPTPQITEIVDKETGEVTPMGETQPALPQPPPQGQLTEIVDERTGEVTPIGETATPETAPAEKPIGEIEQQAKEAVQPLPKETKAKEETKPPENVTTKETNVAKNRNLDNTKTYESILDDNNNPTGWVQPKKNKSVIIDPVNRKQIAFKPVAPENATAKEDTETAAKNHAINNPITEKPKQIKPKEAEGGLQRETETEIKPTQPKVETKQQESVAPKPVSAVTSETIPKTTTPIDEKAIVETAKKIDSNEYNTKNIPLEEAKELVKYLEGRKDGGVIDDIIDDAQHVYNIASDAIEQRKEPPSAKETGKTVGETGRKEGAKGGEEERIRVRDTEGNGLATKTGKEIKTPKGVIAEVSDIPGKSNLNNEKVYEPVLNLNKKPTGWVRPKNNKSVLIDPESRKQVVFKAVNPQEATAKAKTNTAASGYAINNPITKGEAKPVTEQVRERLGLEGEAAPETKEKPSEPTGKGSGETPVSPAKSAEGEVPTKAKEKKVTGEGKEKAKAPVTKGGKPAPKTEGKTQPEPKEAQKETSNEEYDIIDGSGEVTAKGYSGAQSNEAMGLSLEGEVDTGKKAKKAKGPVSKHTISEKLGELNNTPIRLRRYRGIKKALGIFKVRPREIRISEAGNIPVIAHEVGHSLERNILEMMQFDSKRWPAIRKELSALGKALYGKNRPSNGYISEGWAEYWNYFFSKGDKLKKYAPVTDSYVRDVFFKDNPKFQEKVDEIKTLVDAFKKQGALEYAASQIVPEKNENMVKQVIDQLNKENFIEEAAGIETAVKRMDAIKADNVKVYENLLKNLEEWKTRELKRNPSKKKQILNKYTHLSNKYKKAISENKKELTTAKNPFTAFKALRRTGSSIAKYMAERGMLDSHRRVVGRPLSDATKLIRKYKTGESNFEKYLYSRRAQEYHRLGLDPGIPLKVANYNVENLEKTFPEFSLAAQIVHDWNRGILNYANEMGAIPDDTVAKIKEKWDFYFPFERVFPYETKALKKMKGGQIVYGSKGSALPIRKPFETMLKEAERVIDAAHQRYVLDRLFELKDVEGIGEIMVEVPRDMVPKTFELEQIKSQLEGVGVDLDNVDLTEMITTFTPAKRGPKGEPIIPKVVNVNGKETIKWFYVNEDLYRALDGMNKVNTLGPFIDFFFGKPARTFKMGTTGLRASFSLSNAQKDFRVALFQASGKKDPKALLEFLGNTIESDYGKLVELAGGKPSEFNDLFDRLGLPMSQALGIDIKHTRRAAKDLFRGKTERVVKNPVDFLRDLIQITEGGPRVASIEKMAKERGIDINNMTMDQMFDLIIEGSEVSTDFRAAGRWIRVANQIVPFLNPNIQGKRKFYNTWKKDPKKAILIGLVTMTLPSLFLWYKNKDKDWYKDLDDFEKYMYDNVEAGDNIFRIARAHEWSLIFQTIPIAMIDAAYKEDPEGVKALVENIINSEVPNIMPHTLQIFREQWRNEVDFTKRPIVSRADIDKPKPEQYGPYTSQISIGIANMFKELNWSPNRIDHIIRSTLGGVGQDILSATRKEKLKGKELANIPVVGRFFRWGGKYSFRNKPSTEFYDLFDKYNTLANSKEYEDYVDIPLEKAKTAEDRRKIENAIGIKLILTTIRDFNKQLKVARAMYKEAKSSKERQTIAKGTTDMTKAKIELIKTMGGNLDLYNQK